MQLRNLAFVLCRLLALVVALFMVLPLTGASVAVGLMETLFIGYYGQGTKFAALVGFMLLFLVPSLFLWFKADWISKLIAPFDSTSTVAPDVETLQQAVFSFFGLYLVLAGLKDLWDLLFLLFWNARINPDLLASFQTGPPVARIAFSLAIGMFLLLGSRGLVGLMRYLKHAGVKYG